MTFMIENDQIYELRGDKKIQRTADINGFTVFLTEGMTVEEQIRLVVWSNENRI